MPPRREKPSSGTLSIRGQRSKTVDRRPSDGDPRYRQGGMNPRRGMSSRWVSRPQLSPAGVLVHPASLEGLLPKPVVLNANDSSVAQGKDIEDLAPPAARHRPHRSRDHGHPSPPDYPRE